MDHNEDINDFIQRMLARPKKFRVTTFYADGTRNDHDVHSMGQAENWAMGERAKLNRDLIDRLTGKIVRRVKVTINRI